MSSTIVLITLVSILLFLLLQKAKAYYNRWKYIRLLPGPSGYPIIGNLFDLMKNPEGMFAARRHFCLKYPYIFKTCLLDNVTVFILRPDDIEALLTNMKHLQKGYIYNHLHNWLGTGLVTSAGAKWQNRRKILTPAFHFSILQQFVEIFNRETETLLKVFEEVVNEPHVDLVAPITEFALSSIGETSLGVQINREPKCREYKQAIYDFGKMLTYRIVRPWIELPIIYNLHPISRLEKKTLNILHNFSATVIQKRKKNFDLNKDSSYFSTKRLALLDLLLKARQSEGVVIDDEGIREEVDTFMLAGHETTSVSICYTLLALANEPKIQEEMYQEIIDVLGNDKKPDYKTFSEMTYMDRCVKESLRLYPSAPGIVRTAGEDIVTKDGYFLPKGTQVNVSIFNLHHSPTLWEDPEKFDPDRFLPENIAKRHPFSYVPFSAGSRNCIGQKFAVLELKTVLCGVLRKFKLEAVDKPSDLVFKSDLVLRPSCPVRVKFVPRN